MWEGGGIPIPPPLFFPYVAKRIPDSVGYIQFEPCHVCAIFTQWFTFSKDNHGENICRQLSGCSTICSSSNLIVFFIYFVNVNHVFKAKNEPAGLRRMIGAGDGKSEQKRRVPLRQCLMVSFNGSRALRANHLIDILETWLLSRCRRQTSKS